MWTPDDPTKFSNQFKYIELMRFHPTEQRMFREKGSFTWDDVEKYRNQYSNVGIYTSVFRYQSENFETTSRLASLYFDLDSDEPQVSHDDTVRIVEYFRNFVPDTAIRIYFTGLKGFHVEIEALALGIGASPKLSDTFRFIAKKLAEELNITTIDFQCYDGRRMWRLPNSQHQKSGLYKIGIDYEVLQKPLDTIAEYAKEPNWNYLVPEQNFEPSGNEWYREYTYRKEVEQQDPWARIRKFESMGTNLIVDDYNGELEFDPVSLFEHCPSLMGHWETAERTHYLTHEARLFLCSMLSYNDEAERYLHQILSNTQDYNPNITQAHINDWKRRRELGIGGKPVTCAKAQAWGVGCLDCDLVPKEKIEIVNGQKIRTGELADPSPIRFAYFHKKRKG